LLGVDQEMSDEITCQIDEGDLSRKPGWVRVSMHPTSTDAEAKFIASSIAKVIENIREWETDYHFEPSIGDYLPNKEDKLVLSLDDFSQH